MNNADDLLQYNIDVSKVREIWFENAWYYSIIDFIAEFVQVDNYKARNYYHVLKNRFSKNNEAIVSPLKQFKLKSNDGKYRLTDCTTNIGIAFIAANLANSIELRKKRIEIRKADEVINFHPKVIKWLGKEGYLVRHHIKLSSGNIVDMLATKNDKTYLIECKPELSKAKIYQAIGQVLCYASEYGQTAIPVIACYKKANRDSYLYECCTKLKIDLIEIVR